MDTIFALSSGAPPAGTAVVRVSGTQAAAGDGEQAAPNNTPTDNNITEGTVIVNPQTKERMVLKNGQWVPVGAGR